jgi:hypothetical protein
LKTFGFLLLNSIRLLFPFTNSAVRLYGDDRANGKFCEKPARAACFFAFGARLTFSAQNLFAFAF